jgi:hypothetical protein
VDHTFYTDADVEPPDQVCDRNGQVVLADCKICGLVEGSLATDCPGTAEHGRIVEVYNGNIDFINGHWVEAVSPHSPARFYKADSNGK